MCVCVLWTLRIFFNRSGRSALRGELSYVSISQVLHHRCVFRFGLGFKFLKNVERRRELKLKLT